MKKRLLSWLLVLTMITSLIPSTLITSALAAALPSQYDAEYNAAKLDAATSFEDGKTYRLTGTGNVPVKISASNTVTIVLDRVTINSTTSPIQVETGAKLTLIPKANTVNTLTCTSDTAQAVTDNSAGGLTAGISVPEGAELVIDKDDAGDGTLTVTGGYGGAGIGGGYGGNYSATKAASGNDGTPGTKGKWNSSGGNAGLLGAGGTGGRYGLDGSNAGKITVNGSVLTVTGGAGAAAIGGGKGVDGEAGAKGNDGTQGDVGGRSDPHVFGNGSSGGAGAGGNGGNGGAGGNGGIVTITGGAVTANATGNASAIGGGSGGVGGNGGNGGSGGAALDGYTAAFHWGDILVTQGGGGAGGNGAGGYAGRGGQGGNAGTLTITGGKVNATGYNGFGPGAVGQDGTNGSGTRTDGSTGNKPNVVWTAHPTWSSWGDAGEYYSVAQNGYTLYVAKPTTGGNGGDVGGAQASSNANGDAGTLTITGSSANVDFTSTGGGDLTNGRPTDINGDALYRVELTISDLEKSSTIEDANVNVTIPASSGKTSYTYKTVSENNGKAVLWLPAGTYTLEQKAVNHATLGEIPKDASVTLVVGKSDSNKQDVMIGVVVKVTADRTDKVYFAQDRETPVNIQVDTSEVNQTIASVKWFRETVNGNYQEYAKSDTGIKKSFDEGYGKIADGSGDKGTLTNPAAGVYSLPINQNGRYWVQIEYTSNDVAVKLVKGLVVSNIYREYPIKVRSYIYEGDNSLHQPIIRQDTGYTDPPDKAGAPTAQTYGFAWDLNGYDAQNPNGANLLSSDVAPYDTLILNAKTANHTWYVAEVNGNPFADTTDTKDFEPIKLTLDGSFFQNQYCDSENSVKDPGKYTIRYSARDGALDVVTIHGVIKDAAPGTDPLYTHTRSYTDAIDNDSITAINWPEYKLVGVQVNGTDKSLDKDVDGKDTSSITITDIHGKDSGKENKIQTVTFLYKYNMTDVTINAWYEGTTTPVEGLSSYKEKMEISKEYTPTAPTVDGHDLTGSSLQDGKFTPTGKNDVITFYYTKSSGNVTYKAVDGKGNTLWTGSGKVAKGAVPTDVTPDYGITNMTKNDAAATSYTKTVDGTDYGNGNKYDGVNDMTVTYTYKHITRNVTVQKIDTTKSGADAVIGTETAKPYNVGSYQTIAPANTPSGYEIVGDDSKTVYIEAGTGDLVVKFYYRPSTTADVTIKLFEADDSGNKVGTEPFQTMTVKVSYGQEQTINAPTITGWAVTGKTTEKVNVKNGETAPEIEFLYKPVYDTITVYAKIQGDDISAPLSTETYQVQQGQSFKAQAPSVVNYKLADGAQSVQSLTAEQIKDGTTSLTFRYVKAEADLITITVNGVDANGNELYSYTKDVKKSANAVEIQVFTLAGYKLDNVKMDKTVVNAVNGTYTIDPASTEQTVTATYSDNMTEVTINGYYKDTTTSVFTSFKVKAEVGKAFTYNAPVLVGYNNEGDTSKTIDSVAAGNSIIFYYSKSEGNVTYKAQDETGKDLAVKTVTAKKGGAIVMSTNQANKLFAIPYYQVKTEGVVTTNAADKTKYDGVNDVTVTYTYERIKKAVTIEKYDQATGLKIDGADQTTVALAAGETHNVTLTDVAGYTSLDSSISIFVDGTDDQTVKAYYKQSDEVFITVKQMCGGVLLNSYKVPAQYGVKQEIKAPDMPGYTKPTGTFEATPIKDNADSMVVTLEYTLDAWEVAVKLIDAAGKDITPAGFEKTYQVKKGDGFTIAAPNVNGYRLNGNTLVVSKSADDLNTEANRTITFKYDKIEDVIGDYQAKVTIKAQYNGYALADDRTQVVTKGKDATVVPNTFEGYVVSQYKLGENGTLNDAKNGVTVNVTENTDLYLIYTRPDNSVVLPGGDGMIPAPSDQDNVIVKPSDGTTIEGPKADGSVKIPDNGTGTVTRPDPDNKLDGKEDIIVPGGTTIDKDGTIHLPDGGGDIKPDQKIPDALPNTYVAITYDSNNSNQEVKKEIGKAGVLKVSDSLFTDPSNRSFAGWNDSGSGNGKTYAKDTKVSANITLYAVWNAQYRYSTNIIYKANDGTTNQDTQLVSHATDPVLKGKLQNSPFQVSGWTFGGWNEAANGSGTLYQPGNVLTLQNQVNKTLFAQWFKTNTDGSITVPGSDGNPNNPDTNATGNGNGTENPRRNDKGEIEIPKGGSVTLPDGSVIGMPDGGKLLPNGTVIVNRPDTDKDGKSDGTITIPGTNGNPGVTDKDGKDVPNAKVFTLTYDINNGENDEVLVKVVEGDAVSTIKNPFTWTGHIFLNWMREANGKEYPAEAAVTNVADKEVFHAQWAKVNLDGSIELPGKDGILDGKDTATGTDHSKDNVTVTPADPDNGGKLTPQPDGSVKVEDSNGGTVNRPKDSNDLDAGREDIKVPNGTVIAPDGTIHLPDNGGEIKPGHKLPDATPNGYVSVVYKANGGTGDDVIDLIKNDQTTINAIKNPFTNGSQTFTGWNTVENGINGTAYGEGAKITGITGKSVTLYAQWTKSTAFKYSAKLIYLPNDGTGEASKIEDTVGANDSQTFSENLRAANTFTVTGWTFGGWNDAANGTGTLNAANAVIEVTANVDQTWYAQWYKTNADGSITVPGKDGNPNTAGDNVTANGNPVRRDDTTGNIEIPAGGSVITPNGEITLPDGGILKPDGTVIINLPDTNNNGKPDNTITVPGANGTDPDVKDENGNTDNTKTAVVLTYQANNGSGKEVKVYTVSDKATQALTKDTFTYSGHEFLYWQSGNTTYKAADEITPNGNMILSAVWAKGNPDGSIELPGKDGKLDGNNGEEKDNVIVTPDSKDGLEGPKDDGSVEVKPDHDATVTRPDPTDPNYPNGNAKEDIKVPEGTIIKPDGTIILPEPKPNGTEVGPDQPFPDDAGTYATVTFKAGIGTGNTVKMVVEKDTEINLLDESAFTAPADSYFVGWTDAAGKSYEASAKYKVTGAATFTAQYEKRDELTKAVAIFDYAGGVDANKNGSKYFTGKAGFEITNKPTPTRTGYKLNGWKVNGQPVNAFEFGEVGSVTVFVADWTIESYNVTFANDDTKGTMSGYTGPIEVEYGSSVANVPTIAESTGNVFVGWLNNSDNSIYTQESTKHYVVTGNVTFTAQYANAADAIVIFDYDGGTANGKYSDYRTGTPGAKISDTGVIPTPTRGGDLFTGWDKTLDENTVFGDAGTVTVYVAQWNPGQKQTFTVNFKIDAAKGDTADTTEFTDIESGSSVTSVPAVTPKAGYKFVGWKDQDDKLFYEAGILLYPITKNTTFTAEFEEINVTTDKATVIFDANGGKIGNNSVLTKVGDPGAQVENIANPVRAGYTFVSWLDEQGDAVDAANIVYGAADTTATYTAKWEAIEYTIHFSATGASGATADQTYKFDGTTKNSLNRNGFTLAGKDFIGWSLTDGATTADFADGALINDTLRAALAASNGSITLYAVWADGVNNNLTVTGSKATAKRDETVDFTAYLNGVATNDVTWIVTGGQSGTHIDANGVLTIGSNESNGTVLTVTAIYKNDTSLTANATVRVVVDSNNNGGNNGGGTVSSSFVIKANAGNGGIISPSGNVSVKRGDDQTFVINPVNGYRIADVIVDGKSVGAVSLYTFENVRANHTIEVVFTKLNSIVADPTETGVAGWLQTREHIAYLGGYGNGLFGPNDNMTRAQVAQMFYNLLLEKDIPVTTSFSDVPADAWYAKAVNTLASLGIIKGIGNDQFAPNRTITRAEFTVIAMRFANVSATVTNPFSDIASSDWYYTAVTSAVSYGWITGYSDGTFKPMATITRAEVATIVNRMLARTADRTFVDSSAVTRFDDVPATYWAYYNIAEATTAHTHTIDNDGVESWGRLM